MNTEKTNRFNQRIQKLSTTLSEEAYYDLLKRIEKAGGPDHFAEGIIDDIENSILSDGEMQSSAITAEERLIAEKHKAVVWDNIRKTLPSSKTVTLQRWRWVSVAAAVTIGILISAYNTQNNFSLFNEITPSGQYTELSTKDFYYLPDGSTVLLNKDSKIILEPSFNDHYRDVYLTGEAYFDVAHDAKKPFRVHTGNVVTTVLGTAFNVNTFNKKVTITVARGKVKVSYDEELHEYVLPDEQLRVNPLERAMVKHYDQLEEAFSWKSDFLILDDITLGEAVTKIGEVYEVSIVFENPSLKNCRIAAKFLNGESLETVLSLIMEITQLQCKKLKNGNIMIAGHGC